MDDKRKNLALSLALKAGRNLLKMRKERLILSYEKAYLDFVSDADEKTEEMIIAEIALNFPHDGVLSEESPQVESKTKYRWIIDPLDGTHNYLLGLKEFGNLIALEENGQTVLSVCYFPFLDEIFVARRNQGAFLNGTKLEVSQAASLRGKIFCSDGVMRRKSKEILADMEKFCSAGCRLRVYGSSPFAFTRIAMGQAVVATNRLGKPWDIAAPALIVEEAGGKVTDEKGNPWSLDSENLLATNGILHNQSLLLFQ